MRSVRWVTCIWRHRRDIKFHLQPKILHSRNIYALHDQSARWYEICTGIQTAEQLGRARAVVRATALVTVHAVTGQSRRGACIRCCNSCQLQQHLMYLC
jgi:hypothetical protein